MSKSIRKILDLGWPGELKYIRKNLHNFIVLADISSLDDLYLITYFLASVLIYQALLSRTFVDYNAPFRGGFVFVSTDETSTIAT